MLKSRYPMVALACLPFAILCITLWGRSFPLGDGGLWYVAANQIVAAKFSLPTIIPFNGEELKFCYPPLAGYILAAANVASGQDILKLLTWMPLFLAAFSLLPFFLFVRNYLRESSAVLWATCLYPFLLFSAPMFFAGGGISRSLGLNFQLAAWWLVCNRAGARPWLRLVLIGLLVGLAVLAHPTAALWSVAGVVFLGIFERRLSNQDLGIILCISIVLALPWLVSVVSHHGIEPFVMAFSVGSGEMWGWRQLGEPQTFLIPSGFLGAIGILGVCFLLRDRCFLVPALLLMGLLIDHRGLFVLHGVVLSGVAIGVACNEINQSLVSKAEREGLALPYAGRNLFLLLLLFLAAVQQADRLVSYYGAMHRNADTPELFERVSLKLGGIEKNLFLRGAGVVERGEWLTVLTAKTIYPLPQATEWSGTYAPQVSTLNNLSKCCSTGSWLCVAESLQPAEMINLRIFIDADTCAELIKSLPKSIKREDIQHFTVLEPDAGLLLRSLGLNGTHL